MPDEISRSDVCRDVRFPAHLSTGLWNETERRRKRHMPDVDANADVTVRVHVDARPGNPADVVTDLEPLGKDRLEISGYVAGSQVRSACGDIRVSEPQRSEAVLQHERDWCELDIVRREFLKRRGSRMRSYGQLRSHGREFYADALSERNDDSSLGSRPLTHIDGVETGVTSGKRQVLTRRY